MIKKIKLKPLGDTAKCVMILMAIALVAGILLGVLNWVTFVDADSAIKEKVAKAYDIGISQVENNTARVVNLSGSKNFIKSVYTAKDADGNEIGYAYHSVGSGAKAGTIELIVYVTTSGQIKDIVAYSQSETAGYFSKVVKESKAKYLGVKLSSLVAFELIDGKSEPTKPSDINNVSQATFTARGFNNAINAVVYAFNNHVEVLNG